MLSATCRARPLTTCPKADENPVKAALAAQTSAVRGTTDHLEAGPFRLLCANKRHLPSKTSTATMRTKLPFDIQIKLALPALSGRSFQLNL
jgi:hypothetical protein